MVNASEAQLEAKASEIEPRRVGCVYSPHNSIIHPPYRIHRSNRGYPTSTKQAQKWMQIYEIGVSCELAFEFVKKNKLRKGVWGVG